MFRSLDRWPAILRVLRSSQVRARPRRHQRPALRYLPPEQLEERLAPAVVTLTVRSLANSGGGTLRQAITKADHAAAGKSYIINIVRPGTITLKTALPDLKRNITINGLGASNTTVRRDSRPATPSFRVFTVDAGKNVRISGLTIAGGKASGTGGGLDNSGTLTVSDCVFSSNSAFLGGGGLSNDGTVIVTGSTFTGNSALFGGGGFLNGGTATVSGSTFTSNSAGGSGGLGGAGGGLDNSRALTVSDCVFSGNSAGGSRGAGGGLNNIGTATVSDCVFSGNSTGGFGGGISGLEGLIQSGNNFTGNSPDDFSH